MAQKRSHKTGKRRTGRPPRGEYIEKRKVLSTRITSKLRDQLEKSTRETGRSLSQEIEFRLDHSFRDEKAKFREFGDKTLYRMMRWFALTIDIAEQITDKSWKTDRETFVLATEAMWTMLNKGMPKGGGLPDDYAVPAGRKLGEQLAEIAAKDRKKER